MHSQQQDNRWRQPVIAWMVALIMVMILFIGQGVTPFGDHNLLIGDLGVQYTAFFTGFMRVIRDHGWTLYSFQAALGGSWIPTVTYYLLSPFNLLLFFFHSSQFPIAIALIIMLKIATIAGTMTFYLQEHWQTYRGGTWVFGLTFAFCGFVTLNFFNLMWLDALIMLPLVAWGLDRLVRTGRTGFYFWSLFITILINYYMGYMTCLFVIGYFVYLLGMKTPMRLGRAWWQTNRALILRFVGTSLLSGISTLFLLLPTVFNMLTSPKVGDNQGAFGLRPLFGLEIFSQFQMGTSNFTQRLSHGPAVFVSSLVILLALAYFALPTVKRREKWWGAGLLGYLFLGMWVLGFNTFWHMLAEPASYPFRNSFFFSFVLIMLAFSAWQSNVDNLAQRWQWQLPVGLGGLMVVGAVSIPLLAWIGLGRYAENLQPWNWIALVVSLFSLGLMAWLLWRAPRKYQWLIAPLVILELAGNFSWSLVGTDYGSQRQFQRNYQTATQRLAPFSKSKKLYRVRYDATTMNSSFSGGYSGYNDPVWLGINGTTAYSSTIQSTTIKMAQQLGLYVKNERRLSGVGFTPVTELLWGVKDKINDQGTVPVKSYYGMGFATNRHLTALKLGNDPIANQEAVLQALRPSQRPYFLPVKLGTDHMYQRTNNRDNFQYHHVLKITPQASGRIYIVDPTRQTKFSTISINHHGKRPAMQADGSTTIINLGKHPKNKECLVKFATTTPSIKEIRITTLRPDALAKAQQTLTGHQLRLHRQKRFRTTYAGRVTATRRTPTLFLSLPTEAGWQVRVDGRLTKVYTSLTGLSSVNIQPGNHRVNISYHVPGGVLGLIMSLLSLGIYALARRLKYL